MEVTAVQSVKLLLMDATGLSRDALHVYAGMFTFLLTALVLRRSLASLPPIFMVLVVACGMEALDARDDLATFGDWRVGASTHDVVNTMFWPMVLFLLARYTQLFGAKARRGR